MNIQAEKIETNPIESQYTSFHDILSETELDTLFDKYNVKDERKRKLGVRSFFWMMIFSATQPSFRGSILHLIGFFLGIQAILCPEEEVDTLSKMAVSKRLKGISWYLFRGVYNHLLGKYYDILDSKEMKYLDYFIEAFAVDGSVFALGQEMEKIFESVHKGKSSLKMHARYSIKTSVVDKMQITEGKRHDSRFSFVTQVPNQLYLIDLGYWSYALMNKIMKAGSFFVMRLKSSCDPQIIAVAQQEYAHFVGKRLSEIRDYLNEHTSIGQIDLTVHLSQAKNPLIKESIRLVGLVHEEQWRFYVTNILDAKFTPDLIYRLYAQRWQVELFFNFIKNVLNLEKIISRTKNGIMIEIYSALIFYLLTQIIIALAAQKVERSIHEFSFERAYKLISGFLPSHFHLFFQKAWDKIDQIFQHCISIVALMGFSHRKPDTLDIHERFA